MKLYWSYNSIPELAGLPKAEQKKRWSEACEGAKGTRQFWQAVVIMCIVLGAFVFVGDRLIRESFWWMGGVAGAIAGFLFGQMQCRMVSGYLRQNPPVN